MMPPLSSDSLLASLEDLSLHSQAGGSATPSSYTSSSSSVSEDPNGRFHTTCLEFVRLDRCVIKACVNDSDGTHKYKTTPIFTEQVYKAVSEELGHAKTLSPVFPQYALIGHLPSSDTEAPSDESDLVFSNTSEPWSAFICGSQGSGKSHTLSCLMENTLLKESPVGVMKVPSAGMIFHYDKFSDFSSGQVCEAAYLCSTGIPVRVLVAPTSYRKMKKQYSFLPGLPQNTPKPKVIPLYFLQEQLSTETMMTLMAVSDTGVGAPLYISIIRQLLRDMQLENQDAAGFNYDDFVVRLSSMKLTNGAMAPLNMRLQLLRSVLLSSDQTPETAALYRNVWHAEPGTLTIIDLSDPFVDESDACALFSICLKIFMSGWQSGPRVVALDEAHKFLTSTTEAQKLTTDLVAVIRQQRHLSSRVFIATQEPTVSGELLDLCNVSFVHRFASPKWFSTLKQHLAGAHTGAEDSVELFRDIVKLATGEAMVFCPTALVQLNLETGQPETLQDAYFKLYVRDRISIDGGKSILPSQRFDSDSSSYANDDDDDSPEIRHITHGAIGGKGTKQNRRSDSSQPAKTATPIQFSSKTGAQVSSFSKVTENSSMSNNGTSYHPNETSSTSSKAKPPTQACHTVAATGTIDHSSMPPEQVTRKQAYSNTGTGAAPIEPNSIVKNQQSTLPSTESKSESSARASPIVAFRCKKGIVYEHVLERTISEEVSRVFGAILDLPRDPGNSMSTILQEVAKAFKIPKLSTSKCKLEAGCKDLTPNKILRRLLREYYNKRNVADNDREQSWLKR